MALNRRDFLELTAASSSALLLSSLDALATLPKPAIHMDTPFDLRIMATNWGFSGTLDEYCARVKKEGYNGIEIWWPTEKKTQDELFAALGKHMLDVGFLCAGFDKEYDKHVVQFTQMVDAAATQTIQRPLYINCHSGRDYFSYEQNKKLVDHTLQLAAKTGLVICHETHRSRMLFAAPVARHYLESIPDLRVTFDVSHWCNVSETLLQDQPETLALTLSRVDHIHARIGHPEGPQVNDPRAPEWADALQAHVSWWDQVVERKKNAGHRLTILTEFGPPDYMPTLPYTREPLADQWAINVHMLQLLRKRYLP
jgi:sugar phosphate isomerase/epimerase